MGQLPVVRHNYGRHGMLAETTHDDGARIDFAFNLHRYLATSV